MRRARTDSFEHTISGLLTKRADLFGEVKITRERLTRLTADIEAIDRVLHVLSFKGDVEGRMPRRVPVVYFRRGELQRFVLDALREADTPLTARQLAARMIESDRHAEMCKRLPDLPRRMAKTLRKLRNDGAVQSGTNERGNLMWRPAVVQPAAFSSS